MKLIFLYGPPAVGKLTVAKALAKLTGYKVFHNHATHDMLVTLFERGTKVFGRLTNKYRLEMLSLAAKHNIPGVIFTYVFYKHQDEPFVREVVRRVKKHGGEVLFVQLTCSEVALIKRVQAEERRQYHKIKSVAVLKTILKDWDCFSPVPGPRHLALDTTRLTPAVTARKIVKFYSLNS